MIANVSLSRSDQSKILAHLRTLRATLAQAREALMHFKDDRLDRDRLEPAARRVDDLMNMFVSTAPDSARGSRWVTEIQSGIEQVTNPKAADALREARVDVTALLRVMGSEGTGNIRRSARMKASPSPLFGAATQGLSRGQVTDDVRDIGFAQAGRGRPHGRHGRAAAGTGLDVPKHTGEVRRGAARRARGASPAPLRSEPWQLVQGAQARPPPRTSVAPRRSEPTGT